MLRIFVTTLLFGHAVAMTTAFGPTSASSRPLLIAVAGLAVGWAGAAADDAVAASLRLAAPMRHGVSTLPWYQPSSISASRRAAGWYPLYLLLTAYAGFHFGIGALIGGGAALGVIGFAAVAATTEFWQQEPALTAECGIALLLLPLLVQDPIRAVAAARNSASVATRGQNPFYRRPGRGIARAADRSAKPSHAGSAQLEHPELPPQVADILDLAAIEAGTYAPQTEPFDLHALVNEALAGGRAKAESRGLRCAGGSIRICRIGFAAGGNPSTAFSATSSATRSR